MIRKYGGKMLSNEYSEWHENGCLIAKYNMEDANENA